MMSYIIYHKYIIYILLKIKIILFLFLIFLYEKIKYKFLNKFCFLNIKKEIIYQRVKHNFIIHFIHIF